MIDRYENWKTTQTENNIIDVAREVRTNASANLKAILNLKLFVYLHFMDCV